jgi:hypothetical protein
MWSMWSMWSMRTQADDLVVRHLPHHTRQRVIPSAQIDTGGRNVQRV